MPKPITHFVVRKLENGDFQIHVEAGEGEYVGDFTIINSPLSEDRDLDVIAEQVREQTKQKSKRGVETG